MTQWLSMCLVYSLDSAGSFSHVSLGVESFHVIARRDCTGASFFSTARTNEHAVSLLDLKKKRLQLKRKKLFSPYKRLRHSTRSISQGTEVTIVTVRFLLLQKTNRLLELSAFAIKLTFNM